MEWRLLPLQERITHSLVKGIDAFIVADAEEARLSVERPLYVIEGYFNDWYECSWRFIWKRKNVFASSCKISKSNEKSSSSFTAIY